MAYDFPERSEEGKDLPADLSELDFELPPDVAEELERLDQEGDLS